MLFDPFGVVFYVAPIYNDTCEFCPIDASGEELMKMAITKIGLSARAYNRILKVSRTKSDLAGEENIEPEHPSEAIQDRKLDRNLCE